MAPFASKMGAMAGGRWAARAPRWTCPISFYTLVVYVTLVAALVAAVVPTIDAAVAREVASRAAAVATGNIVDGCVENYDPETDYFPDKVSAEYADQFTISYHKHYKLVHNAVVNDTYLLVQCGTPVPIEHAHLKTFMVPVHNVSVESTPAVTSLELLGRRTNIRLVFYPTFYTSPCIQFMLEEGSIGAISTNATEAAAQLAAMDVHFAEVSSAPEEPNYVAFSSAFDPGPLERAEWIDYAAAFFNLEALSNQVFADIRAEYECHADNGELYLSHAQPASERPLVAWTSYQYAYWANNTEYWEVSQATYKLELAEDAGARVKVLASPPMGQFFDVNEFHEAIKDVDIIIDETYLVGSYDDFLAYYHLTESSPFKFIANKKIFREDGWLNPADAQDWFEGAIAHPNAVLQSLMGIVHPTYPSKAGGRWFRNIARNDAITYLTMDQCTGNLSEPRAYIRATCMAGIGGSAAPLTAASVAATGAVAALAGLLLAFL